MTITKQECVSIANGSGPKVLENLRCAGMAWHGIRYDGMRGMIRSQQNRGGHKVGPSGLDRWMNVESSSLDSLRADSGAVPVPGIFVNHPAPAPPLWGAALQPTWQPTNRPFLPIYLPTYEPPDTSAPKRTGCCRDGHPEYRAGPSFLPPSSTPNIASRSQLPSLLPIPRSAWLRFTSIDGLWLAGETTAPPSLPRSQLCHACSGEK